MQWPGQRKKSLFTHAAVLIFVFLGLCQSPADSFKPIVATESANANHQEFLARLPSQDRVTARMQRQNLWLNKAYRKLRYAGPGSGKGMSPLEVTREQLPVFCECLFYSLT